MNLLLVEMQRALHRRVVRVLILLALVGCAVVGVIAFTSSVGKTVAELQLNEHHHPAIMRDWWVAGTSDGALRSRGSSSCSAGSSAAHRWRVRSGAPER